MMKQCAAIMPPPWDSFKAVPFARGQKSPQEGEAAAKWVRDRSMRRERKDLLKGPKVSLWGEI